MLGAYREDSFEYFPWILFELLVTQAHATIVLIQFKNDNIDGISNAAKF